MVLLFYLKRKNSVKIVKMMILLKKIVWKAQMADFLYEQFNFTRDTFNKLPELNAETYEYGHIVYYNIMQ